MEESIREQLEKHHDRLKRNGRGQRLRSVKTDSLEWRISRRLRKMAKLYEGIYGYYEDEQRTTDYILQIVRQAIKEDREWKEK